MKFEHGSRLFAAEHDANERQAVREVTRKLQEEQSRLKKGN